MSGMKPCPFCGKEDLYFEQDEEGETSIVCDWCEYKTRIFQTIGDAARWWNTRPIEYDLRNSIAELETENERLSQLLHDEMSQLEIATDLGNKRCAALNKIYEDGEKHNTNWCKRIAQEGLGIKNA